MYKIFGKPKLQVLPSSEIDGTTKFSMKPGNGRNLQLQSTNNDDFGYEPKNRNISSSITTLNACGMHCKPTAIVHKDMRNIISRLTTTEINVRVLLLKVEISSCIQYSVNASIHRTLLSEYMYSG